jgi:hypothetical protein
VDARRDAEPGVRLVWPREVEVEDEHPSAAKLRDERFHVRWHIALSMLRMDLDPVGDKTLRLDTECFSRAAFQSATPRTEEPGWSPVIDFARLSLNGSDGLLCVYRQSYEPTNEVVVGEITIPLADGTLTVAAYAAAGTKPTSVFGHVPINDRAAYPLGATAFKLRR